MATLSITVKNAALTQVLNFFTLQLNAPYSAFLPDLVTPNPLTLQQHVEQKLEEQFEQQYNSFARQLATQAYQNALPFNDVFGSPA
jgi:hypothetical protein